MEENIAVLALGQLAGRAQGKALAHRKGIEPGRDHPRGPGPPDFLPINPWQPKIQQKQIRQMLLDQRHHHAVIAGNRNKFHVVLNGKQKTQPIAHKTMCLQQSSLVTSRWSE